MFGEKIFLHFCKFLKIVFTFMYPEVYLCSIYIAVLKFKYFHFFIEYFKWDNYLKETGSVAAPSQCFRQVII